MIGTFFWKIRGAIFGAAIEGGSKVVGDIQFFHLDRFEDGMFEYRTQDNGNGNGKVGHHRSNIVVAAKRRISNLAQEESDKGSAQAQNQAEQCDGRVFVIFVQFNLFLIVRMILSKVMEEADL